MLLGHHKNWELFLNFEKLSHAYLFSGLDKIGKKRTAFEIVKLLNCNNLKPHSFYKKYPCLKCKNCLDIEKEIFPDFFLLEKKDEKKEIEIEQARNLKTFFLFKPYNAKFKIAIIDNAHLMNIFAQNALLKILEEPIGAKSIIFLITDKSQQLLKTILSRAQEIKFFQSSNKEIDNYLSEIDIFDKEKDEIKKFSFGKLGLAIDFVNNFEKLDTYKEKIQELKTIIESPLYVRFNYIKKITDNNTNDNILEILILWMNYFKEFLLFDKNRDKNKDILKKINETYILISRTNVNKKLALENLVLEF